MAITVNIFYKGKNGSALSFAKEMIEKGVVKRIREEKGNLMYNYFTSFDDKETILLIDKWENQEALDFHHHSKMMEEIATLRNKYDLSMEVYRYIDDNSAPSSDSKYIRK